MKKERLNLGCGIDIKRGWINVDRIKLKGVDKVWDLNNLPLPFETNSVDEILLSHIIEHIDKPKLEGFLEEIYRIARPNCLISILVPYHRSHYAYTDLQHQTFFCWTSLVYYTSQDDIYSYYTKAKFKVRKQGFSMLSQVPWRRPLVWFANRWPKLYEVTPIAKLFPCDILFWELEVVKGVGK